VGVGGLFIALTLLSHCILYTNPSVSLHSVHSPFCLIAFCALFLLSHCILCTFPSVSLHSVHSPFCLIAFCALTLLSHCDLCTVPSVTILCTVTALCQRHMFTTHVTKVSPSSSYHRILHSKFCRQISAPFSLTVWCSVIFRIYFFLSLALFLFASLIFLLHCADFLFH
jgi:hypothetical protein